jgi:hypothetical protein
MMAIPVSGMGIMAMAAITVATVSFSVGRDEEISNHENHFDVTTDVGNLKGGRNLFDIISVVSFPVTMKSYSPLTGFDQI